MDPGCLGIDGSLPAAQRRDTDPERSGDIRRCEVPSLLQLEHSPVTAAVLVPVDVSRSPAPIVAGQEAGHPPPPPPPAGVFLVFPRPPAGGGGLGSQKGGGSQGG